MSKIREQVSARLSKQPCVEIFGIKLTEAHDGYAKVEMSITDKHLNEIGIVWGTVFDGLADAAGSCAMMTVIGEDNTTPSEELHIKYKNAAFPEDEILVGEAETQRELAKITKDGKEIQVMKSWGVIKSKKDGEIKATFTLLTRIYPLKVVLRVTKKKREQLLNKNKADE